MKRGGKEGELEEWCGEMERVKVNRGERESKGKNGR